MEQHIKYCNWNKSPASVIARRLRQRLYMRRWNAKNSGWGSLTRSLKRNNLTLDQYHAMSESQDFSCAICGDDRRRLRIDHDHGDGHVRGLLCDGCNSGLGSFRDSRRRLGRAQVYLDKDLERYQAGA